MHTSFAKPSGPKLIDTGSLFTQVEGLPANSIRKTVQTPDGLLWIASTAGLIRYDGSQMDHFHSKNTPSLTFDMVHRLVACTNGDLWLASEQPTKLGEPLNLVRYRNGSFQRVDKIFPEIRTHRQELTIRKLLCDGDGGIYLATALDLSHIRKDGSVERIDANGMKFKQLLSCGDGSYLAIGEQIKTWPREKSKWAWVNHSEINSERPKSGFLAGTIEDENTVWIASSNRLFKLNPDGFESWDARDDLGTYNLRSLHIDKNGSLWVGSYEGIFRFEGGALHEPSGKSSAELQLTFDIFEDASGNIWLSQSNGLARLTPIYFRRLSESELLMEFPGNLGKENDPFIDAVAPNGSTIRLDGDKLFQIIEGQIEPIRSIPSKFTVYDWELISVSQNGDIWLGGAGASVLRLGKDSVKHYQAWQGEILNSYIYDLVADPVEGMWAATPDGLSYLTEHESVHLVRRDGLISSDAIAISFDAGHNLWIASSKLLQYVSSESLRDIVRGESSELRIRAWDKEDGYPTSFGIPNTRPILFTNLGDKLFLSTEEGVYQASMSELLVPTAQSGLAITQIFIDGKLRPSDRSTMELPSGKAAVEIHFSIPDFQSAQSTRWRYRLVGVEEDWQSTPSPARYAQLLPGEYEFEIQSRRSNQDWGDPTRISMIVPKLWYQRSSTWGLIALFLLGLIGFTYRLIIANHRRAKALLERRVRESTVDLSNANRKLQNLSDSLRSHSIELAALASDKTELAKRALAADRTKGEFITNIGHEVRTPLNGILGMAQLINDSKPSAEQRELLESIQNCGEHLLQLFDGILQFSELEGGHCKVEHHPVDLGILIESVTSQATNLERCRHLPIICDIEPDLPSEVVLAEEPVRNILYNLLSNAIKFSRQGVVALRLEMEQNDAGAPVLAFTVEDCGKGIPPESQERLFKPFVRLETVSAGDDEGLGLGLAISHRLAVAMSGTLELLSSGNEGSSFRLTIPFQPSGDTEPLKSKGFLEGENLRAWVFASDFRVARALSTVLNKWNLNSQAVNPDSQPLNSASHTLPDLIVLSVADQDDFENWDTYFAGYGPREDLTLVVINHDPFLLPKAKLGQVSIARQLSHPFLVYDLCDSVADTLRAE
jgi:signal transduction histidine kinase/streptogramin lyase